MMIFGSVWFDEWLEFALLHLIIIIEGEAEILMKLAIFRVRSSAKAMHSMVDDTSEQHSFSFTLDQHNFK